MEIGGRTQHLWDRDPHSKGRAHGCDRSSKILIFLVVLVGKFAMEK